MPLQNQTSPVTEPGLHANKQILEMLPARPWAYIIKTTSWHQLGLIALTVAVFLMEVIPLELQRRIVNDAVKHRDFQLILNLCALYVAAALVHGTTKLCLNIYRAWIGQKATRDLRRRIQAIESPGLMNLEQGGTEISMIVGESEPVGQFAAEALSEPLLQVGILVTVLTYMLHLDLAMCLVALAFYVPQIAFVPLFQGAINRRSKDAISTLRRLSSSLMATFVGPVRESESEAENTADTVERVFRLNMGVATFKYGLNFLMNFCTHLQVVAVLVYGGWLVQSDRLVIGGVVAFLSGLSRLTDPWGDLINYFRDLSVTRMKYRLLQRTVNEYTAPNSRPLPQTLRSDFCSNMEAR